MGALGAPGCPGRVGMMRPYFLPGCPVNMLIIKVWKPNQVERCTNKTNGRNNVLKTLQINYKLFTLIQNQGY